MDDIQEMIEDCQNWEKKMNEWEQGFIASISQIYADRGTLTAGQYDKLHNIWEKVTR